MSKNLLTARDVRTWRECGEKEITIGPNDLVTPEAVDLAKEFGMPIRRATLDALEQEIRAVVEKMRAGADTTADHGPLARGAKVTLIRGARTELQPFVFDVKRPDMNIRAVDVVTDAHGSPMGAGFMSFERGSFPWTLNCDAVDIVLEGELEIRFGDESVIGRPGDIIFIPKGTSIFFSTPTRCKFVYVTYPVNWQAG